MAEEYAGLLNQSTPPGSAFLSTFDEQLRLIKAAVKNSHPNVTGAVTLSHTTINGLPASVTAAQTALKNILDPHGYTSLAGAAAATVVPKGGIILWNHNQGAIPSGWRLCDGGTYNSVITPDLRNRFVIGEPTLFGAGTRSLAENATVATGGAHTHGATAGGTALTVAQLPAHSHRIYSAENATGGTNALGDASGRGVAGDDVGASPGYLDTISVPAVKAIENTGSGATHTHTLTDPSAGGHVHTVSSILPIRYVLAYICYCGG